MKEYETMWKHNQFRGKLKNIWEPLKTPYNPSLLSEGLRWRRSDRDEAKKNLFLKVPINDCPLSAHGGIDCKSKTNTLSDVLNYSKVTA